MRFYIRPISREDGMAVASTESIEGELLTISLEPDPYQSDEMDVQFEGPNTIIVFKTEKASTMFDNTDNDFTISIERNPES